MPVSDFERYRFSVTCATNDLAVVYCLRALSQLASDDYQAADWLGWHEGTRMARRRQQDYPTLHLDEKPGPLYQRGDPPTAAELLARGVEGVTMIQLRRHRRGGRGNGAVCSRRSVETIKSYRDVVRAYIRCYRDEAEVELNFFRNHSSLIKAIRYAARSIMPNGKRHPHQRRHPTSVLTAAERRLRAAAHPLRNCRSFAELHDLIRAEIGAIHGIGPLTIYDVATRIGGHIGREPEMVYLHSGTSKGAKALGLDQGEILAPTALPPAFRALRPREMEDCLCIYASELSRLRSTLAVQRR